MNRIFFLSLWIGWLSLAVPRAQDMAALQALLREADAASWHAGICVYDLAADTLVVAYNAQKRMRPASVEKVVTAVCALDQLGKEHLLRTRVYLEGAMEDTILHGDLRIVGGYDPMVSYADVKAIARSVREAGIDSIDGCVVGDVSMTEYKYLGSGWCWDDVPSDVVPYLSPLLFNHELPIDNPKGKFVQQPEAYFLDVLVRELRAAGIGLSPFPSRIVMTASPDPSGQEISAEGHSLEQVLQLMMKKSDNLHAEAVFFQLGNTAEAAAEQMEQTLLKAGAEEGSYAITDGSGLSLYNYVTARTVVQLLRYAYHQPAIYGALYPALPVAGVDGTLERRMRNTLAARNVHAKTGTVTGVSSLAGYVTTRDGRLLAFAILLNGVDSQKEARNFQDRFCIALAAP